MKQEIKIKIINSLDELLKNKKFTDTDRFQIEEIKKLISEENSKKQATEIIMKYLTILKDSAVILNFLSKTL